MAGVFDSKTHIRLMWPEYLKFISNTPQLKATVLYRIDI